MVSLCAPKNMGCIGSVNSRGVMVLVYRRATHNLISKKLEKELRLPISPASLAMTLGEERRGQGCQNFEGMVTMV